MKEKGIRFITEAMGGSMLFGAEIGRWISMRPTENGLPINPKFAEDPSKVQPPAISPENTPDFVYNSLAHSGNIFDGYALTMGFYYFLSLLPTNRLGERIRLGTSWIASNLVVSGVETGLFFGQHRDLLDIPAGVAGSTLFLGARLISKIFAERAIRNMEQNKLALEIAHDPDLAR